MIRNNSYLVYTAHHKEKAEPHKDFLYAMIKGLLTKAHFYAKHNPSGGGNRASITRKRTEEAEAAVSRKKVTRHGKQNEHQHTSDFPQLFNTTLVHSIGKPTTGKMRGSCVMCSSIYYDKVQQCKAVGDEYAREWKAEVKWSYQVCFGCSTDQTSCFLCKKHAHDFHTAP